MKKLIFIIVLFAFNNVIKAQNSRKAKLDDYTFGMQFKPIIPVNYFGIEPSILNDTVTEIGVFPKYGYSMGMVMRRNFTSLISLETGISYIRRNYNIKAQESSRDTSDLADFGFISYAIPFQGLIYIRLSEKLFMNTSAGMSLDFYPSSVQSLGENRLIQSVGLKRYWMHFSMLANLGFEYRTAAKGNFYIGASLVNPFKEIIEVRIDYNYDANLQQRYTTKLKGNYITLDFRYFFPVQKKATK